MAKRENLKVEKRTINGKKVKKLRREGLLPTNIYGKDIKSIAVQLPVKEFKVVFKKVHETGLIDLELDSKTLPVLIHNVQFDPRSNEPLHADFYKVDLKEKIRANIPVVAVDEAPAVKDNKGLLLQLLSEIEVEALPTDLPEKIEVSIAKLNEIGEEISVANLKALDGVTIVNELSQIIFRIGELVSKAAEEQAKAEEAAAAEAKTTEGAEATAEAAEVKTADSKEEKPEQSSEKE